ncbi:NPCBM/NEW2 domain-containing protein [Deinococcus arenicola]|uniref:NPCBM/NEW2 domain-containing protein n=1 Tax=Deinococcus arenicola TaxID=2994950 RepID=A0ABU4DVC2_9DEIO|nr:NPCBM/NEW2 domain-containing protein [Deinococcus sp. ZS9-10]MDV6376386.1 NPCBM/NEW2 domain-containing protein [Deinococcus sp. ZS9-10]
MQRSWHTTCSTLALITLALTACSSTTDTPPAATATTSGPLLSTQAIGAGTSSLSSQTPIGTPVNGYGPYEINRSNGLAGAGDGAPLTLNGTVYASGLGVHANSSLTFDVGAQCRTFTAKVGLDDEVGSLGSVSFKVLVDGFPTKMAVDGTLASDTGVMTGATATKSISVDIEGAETLTLVVDGGANIDYDHADWADAMLNGCITYDGPITISAGGTYTGNWRSTVPGQAAVTISTSAPVKIENSNIAGRHHLIKETVSNVDLTVTGTRAYGLNPNLTTARVSRGRFINLYRPKNLTVRYNTLIRTGGIYVDGGCSNNMNSIAVQYNRAKNIDGRRSDGMGGLKNTMYQDPNNSDNRDVDYVQFAQLNGVKAIQNADISWNEVINEPGNSRVEDNINIHVSSGTAANKLKIHDNYIQGAYHAQPTLDGTGPQYSGGGIMLGDGQGCPGDANQVPAYLYAYNNQVVSTGNYGIAITSGHDNLAENNRVVSRGRVGAGLSTDPNTSTDYANALNLYKPDQFNPAFFYNNIIRNNTIGLWRFRAGNWERSDTYLPGCAAGICNNNALSTVDYNAEVAEFAAWKNRLITGPHIGAF